MFVCLVSWWGRFWVWRHYSWRIRRSYEQKGIINSDRLRYINSIETINNRQTEKWPCMYDSPVHISCTHKKTPFSFECSSYYRFVCKKCTRIMWSSHRSGPFRPDVPDFVRTPSLLRMGTLRGVEISLFLFFVKIYNCSLWRQVL